MRAVCSLTAKLEVSRSADDGSTAVDGQTLVRAGVPARVGAAYHQVAGHQRVAKVQTKRYFCAIHEPSASQSVINRTSTRSLCGYTTSSPLLCAGVW